jgi:peptidoglycan/LPS O-acetylase OafA/YrhL
MNPPASAGRLLPVDLLKVVAAHLIVWHHLAFYGPMADRVAPVWPDLFDTLAEHGRLAVTVFLVVGGFLAARSLAPEGRLPADARPLALLADRWWRLAAPFGAVLVVALPANLLAARWMDHPSIDVPADATTWLMALGAHLVLLHDLLGVPALTAGAWYVAIDFQLYALLLALLVAGRAIDARGIVQAPIGAPVLVAVAGLTSMYAFNRQPAWDVAAPYFAGAYALGVAAAWSGRSPLGRAWLLVAALAVAGALVVEWRIRLALAAAVAALLMVATASGLSWASASGIGTGAGGRAGLVEVIRAESDRSYALFLVHFPVALVVNAAFTRFMPPTPAAQGAGLLLAWGASLLAARGFHRWVERPLHAAWRRRSRCAVSDRRDRPARQPHRDGSAGGS